MKTRILVAAVFLVGCAVGGVSSQLVVPKASAQQAGALTKWETQCWFGDWDELPLAGSRFGAEGWEMVTAQHTPNDHAAACFKRPKM